MPKYAPGDPNDPIRKLQSGKIPKEWKKILKEAKIQKKDLRNEEAARMVYQLIMEHLAKHEKSGGGGRGGNGGGEVGMISANAAVYTFDPHRESWTPADAGLSKVEIFNNTANNSYRVVAVSLQDQRTVINSAMYASMQYTQASESFHQWSDASTAYGLNFASIREAETFSRTFAAVLNMLAKAPPAGASGRSGGGGGGGGGGGERTAHDHGSTSPQGCAAVERRSRQGLPLTTHCLAA